MRKRNVKNLFDYVMWYMIYLLPLIILIVSIFRTGSIIPLSDCFNNLGLTLFTDNFILVSLTDLFGSAGVVPLFASADILVYLSYFICCLLLHIAVDILAFIPRFAHGLMDKFGGKND